MMFYLNNSTVLTIVSFFFFFFDIFKKNEPRRQIRFRKSETDFETWIANVDLQIKG